MDAGWRSWWLGPGPTGLTMAADQVAYMVRPDGYVGFRGAPPRAEVLRLYLGRLFVAA